MKIKKLPNILALHLKRFKYQEQLQKYIKLTYRVVFPFELRLFNTVIIDSFFLKKKGQVLNYNFRVMIQKMPIECMNFGVL